MIENLQAIFKALKYAADKHQNQRRADYAPLPYINHLIKVTDILLHLGISDTEILQAAILHDVIEDTDATKASLAELFGEKVAHIVEELSDNMELSYHARKKLQVVGAHELSTEARIIRIADKIANMRDIVRYPVEWTLGKKKAYVTNSVEIVDQIRGTHSELEKEFDKTVEYAIKQLNKK